MCFVAYAQSLTCLWLMLNCCWKLITKHRGKIVRTWESDTKQCVTSCIVVFSYMLIHLSIRPFGAPMIYMLMRFPIVPRRLWALPRHTICSVLIPSRVPHQSPHQLPHHLTQ